MTSNGENTNRIDDDEIKITTCVSCDDIDTRRKRNIERVNIYTEDELMDFAMYVVLEKPLKAYNDMSREAFEKVLEKWKAKRD